VSVSEKVTVGDRDDVELQDNVNEEVLDSEYVVAQDWEVEMDGVDEDEKEFDRVAVSEVDKDGDQLEVILMYGVGDKVPVGENEFVLDVVTKGEHDCVNDNDVECVSENEIVEDRETDPVTDAVAEHEPVLLLVQLQEMEENLLHVLVGLCDTDNDFDSVLVIENDDDSDCDIDDNKVVVKLRDSDAVRVAENEKECEPLVLSVDDIEAVFDVVGE
jgi:hypothetical protein